MSLFLWRTPDANHGSLLGEYAFSKSGSPLISNVGGHYRFSMLYNGNGQAHILELRRDLNVVDTVQGIISWTYWKYRITAVPATTIRILWWGSTWANADVRLRSDGKVIVTDAAGTPVTKITSTTTLSIDTDYWIGIEIDNTLGAGSTKFTLYINGTAEGNATWNAGVGTGFRGIFIGGQAGKSENPNFTEYFSYAWISDNDGTTFNSDPYTFLSSTLQAVNVRLPTSDGDLSEMTSTGAAHYTEVDDAGDGDTTMVSVAAATAGPKWDTFGLDDETFDPSSQHIAFVAALWSMAYTGSAVGADQIAAEAAIGFRIGGVTYSASVDDANEIAGLTTGYTLTPGGYLAVLDPATGAAWLKSGFNAAQLAIAKKGTGTATGVKVSAAWVQVVTASGAEPVAAVGAQGATLMGMSPGII